MAKSLAERQAYLPGFLPGEERSFLTILGLSLLVHIMFFVFDKADWIDKRDLLYEEWEVQADLIDDLNPSAPTKSELPNAKEAEEARVPDTMLPQLPKKFELEQQKKEEASISEVATPEKKTAEKEVAGSTKATNEKKADPD